MTSELRLQILSGDFASAAAGSLAVAQRYADVNAYRDYLSFLHAFGQHNYAWQGFSQLNAALTRRRSGYPRRLAIACSACLKAACALGSYARNS